MASKDGAVPTFKLNYRDQPAGAYAEYYASKYTFLLKANDPKSGSLLAHATCSATAQGTVLSMSSTPQDGVIPTLAAGL
jgi:hypothetical protein